MAEQDTKFLNSAELQNNEELARSYCISRFDDFVELYGKTITNDGNLYDKSGVRYLKIFRSLTDNNFVIKSRGKGYTEFSTLYCCMAYILAKWW